MNAELLNEFSEGRKKILSFLRRLDDKAATAGAIDGYVFSSFADEDLLSSVLEAMVQAGDLERDGDLYRIPQTRPRTQEEAISDAVAMILAYGGTDGAHHKQWVLDQTLRILLGVKYEDAIREYCFRDGEIYEWDEGIAP